jgi:hypothetical protein
MNFYFGIESLAPLRCSHAKEKTNLKPGLHFVLLAEKTEPASSSRPAIYIKHKKRQL